MTKAKHTAGLTELERELLEALEAVKHIVLADAKRCLELVGDDEESAGKADGAVVYIEQLDAAIAKAKAKSKAKGEA